MQGRQGTHDLRSESQPSHELSIISSESPGNYGSPVYVGSCRLSIINRVNLKQT